MSMTIEVRPGLPDAETEPEFYEGVPAKRLVAWVFDVIAIGLLTLLALPLTAFTGIFYFPFLFFLVGFLYRWVGLSQASATLGMRFAAIEVRDADGERLESGTAFLHTAGYAASVAVFPAQLVSIALMLVTPRRQGLTDLVLGTAAIRRMRTY